MLYAPSATAQRSGPSRLKSLLQKHDAVTRRSARPTICRGRPDRDRPTTSTVRSGRPQAGSYKGPQCPTETPRAICIATRASSCRSGPDRDHPLNHSTYRYPSGLLLCQRQVSSIIFSRLLSADHPNRLLALSAFAQKAGRSPLRRGANL